LKGLESVAGDFCAGFASDLHEELVAASKPAPVPEAPKAAPEQAAEAPVENFDFRITCLKYEDGSVMDSFHLSLPEDFTVEKLRGLLGAALPSNAQVCELDGMGFKNLKDEDILPAWVTLEEFKGVINMDMALTTNQCKEAQAMMKATLRRPTIQKMLDQAEKEADGKDTKYRMLLTKTLNKEVYPDIVSHFNLPDGVKGMQILLGSIPAKSDLGMVEKWLELEKLMRNKAMIKRAEEALANMRMMSGHAVGA